LVASSKPISESELRGEIVRSFQRFDPQSIILFGSHAKGDADDESDIDLIVVYETDKRFLDRLRELYMAWNLPRGVDILAYTPAEFADLKVSREFVRNAVRTGRVLYERA
jgi:uncharacterized protein